MALTKVTNRMQNGEAVSLLDFMSSSQASDVISNTGSVDVTNAVQSAFDSGNKVLIAPAGVYLLTNTITCTDNVSLIGEGQKNTVFNFVSDVGTSKPAFDLNLIQGPIIKDFTLHYLESLGAPVKNWTDQSNTSTHVGLLLKVYKARIENIRVRGFSHGCSVNGTTSDFFKCDFVGNKIGLSFNYMEGLGTTPSTTINFSGCVFEQNACGFDAFDPWDEASTTASQPTIVGYSLNNQSTIQYNELHGIRTCNMFSSMIENCWFEDNGNNDAGLSDTDIYASRAGEDFGAILYESQYNPPMSVRYSLNAKNEVFMDMSPDSSRNFRFSASTYNKPFLNRVAYNNVGQEDEKRLLELLETNTSYTAKKYPEIRAVDTINSDDFSLVKTSAYGQSGPLSVVNFVVYNGIDDEIENSTIDTSDFSVTKNETGNYTLTFTGFRENVMCFVQGRTSSLTADDTKFVQTETRIGWTGNNSTFFNMKDIKIKLRDAVTTNLTDGYIQFMFVGFDVTP